MEALLLDILNALRTGATLSEAQLDTLTRSYARGVSDGRSRFAKKRILPFYLRIREEEPERWASWNVNEALERRLLETLRAKPRRTASGVATITVITKPWGCSSNCLYCPNDIRMPKSYLHNEPACQRAERSYFDPYLQVASRLHVLEQMGHITDKVELIVLGGTWTDYPENYQTWFMRELFRALNEGGNRQEMTLRRQLYQQAGIAAEEGALALHVDQIQAAIDTGKLSFNRAIEKLYGKDSAWERVANAQSATLEELEAEQRRNESASHRVVGLVVETRPDCITPQTLTRIRQLGCTKVQIGVQSLDPCVLQANHRRLEISQIERAFSLLRLFGFKIHAHFMVNLLGATPQGDLADYRRFVTEAPFQPDEVKLYPCALIGATGLAKRHQTGEWTPYCEDTLVDILVDDVAATPPFVRISRMIRDFSSNDIIAGNKKTNLRQLVEDKLKRDGRTVREIRMREIGVERIDARELRLNVVPYETSSTSERFLEWIAPDNRIAGFLRLSLPHPSAVEEIALSMRANEALQESGLHVASEDARTCPIESDCSQPIERETSSPNEPPLVRPAESAPICPIELGCAMIREVHVYGQVAQLHGTSGGAQHLGLGRQLIERACDIAREAGYEHINVISSVGTRDYYRKLGFEDAGLYQQKEL